MGNEASGNDGYVGIDKYPAKVLRILPENIVGVVPEMVGLQKKNI